MRINKFWGKPYTNKIQYRNDVFLSSRLKK